MMLDNTKLISSDYHSILKDRNGLWVGLINFTVSFVSFSILYFYPQFFEIVQQKTASQAGAHLLPNSVALSIGSLFAGYVSFPFPPFDLHRSSFSRFPLIAIPAPETHNNSFRASLLVTKTDLSSFTSLSTGHSQNRQILLPHRHHFFLPDYCTLFVHLPQRELRLRSFVAGHLTEWIRFRERNHGRFK